MRTMVQLSCGQRHCDLHMETWITTNDFYRCCVEFIFYGHVCLFWNTVDCSRYLVNSFDIYVLENWVSVAGNPTHAWQFGCHKVAVKSFGISYLSLLLDLNVKILRFWCYVKSLTGKWKCLLDRRLNTVC